MIHTLANLPKDYESKVESLETKLDNEDDPLTLDRMSIELDAKYKKICKKIDYYPENENDKKSKQRNQNNSKALAAAGNGQLKGRCYICRNWGQKSHQCPFRNNKILKMDKLRKMSQLRTILQTQIKTRIQTKILRQTIQTTAYLPEGLGFQENVITVENGEIGEKTVGF